MGEKYEVVGHVVGSRVKNVGDKITKSGLNGVKPSSLFNFLSVFIFVSVFAGITICLVNLRFVFRCQTSWKESQNLANINTQSMPRPTSRGFVGPHRGFERLEAMSRSPTADRRRPEKGVDVSCPWGGLIQALFKSKFKILRNFQSTDPLNLSFAHVSKYHFSKPLGSVGPFNFQASFPYAPCVLHTKHAPEKWPNMRENIPFMGAYRIVPLRSGKILRPVKTCVLLRNVSLICPRVFKMDQVYVSLAFNPSTTPSRTFYTYW